MNALSVPEGHKDGVPFLVHHNLLGQKGLGSSLVLNQVVFSHKHPVGELGAAGQNRLLKLLGLDERFDRLK